jgi:hypothetical protein
MPTPRQPESWARCPEFKIGHKWGASTQLSEPWCTEAGANARLEVTFVDNIKLTLGENARVVIDRYVDNPDRSIGVMA